MNNRNNTIRNILRFACGPAMGVAVLVVLFWGELNRDAFGATQDDLAVPVDALIRRLDSPIRNERDDAERALLERGPDVLPLLPPETMLISAEVRLRLDRIRKTLGNKVFLEFLASAPITMPEGRVMLGRVAEELTLQSGNRVEATEGFLDRVLEWTNPAPMPFWPTVDGICVLGELRFEQSLFASEPLSPEKKDLGLIFMPLEPISELASEPASDSAIEVPFVQIDYSGPFRIAFRPDWTSSSFTRTESSSDEPETFRLETTLWWESRLRIVRLDVPHANFSGRDATRSRFKARTPDAVLEIPVDGKALSKIWTLGMEAEDNPAAEDADESTRFEAQFEAIALGRDHDFIFENAGRYPSVQTFGDATVVLEDVRQTPSGWEFDVRVTYAEGHGVFASHYAWYYANRAALLSREEGVEGNERSIEASSSMMDRQFSDGFVMTYVFRRLPELRDGVELDGLEDVRFSYRTPAFLRSLRIDTRR